MKKYADRIREYEIKKAVLIMSCKDPNDLQKELKLLAKKLKV